MLIYKDPIDTEFPISQEQPNQFKCNPELVFVEHHVFKKNGKQIAYSNNFYDYRKDPTQPLQFITAATVSYVQTNDDPKEMQLDSSTKIEVSFLKRNVEYVVPLLDGKKNIYLLDNDGILRQAIETNEPPPTDVKPLNRQQRRRLKKEKSQKSKRKQ